MHPHPMSLEVFGSLMSLFLIVTIYLRVPPESAGLASFANKSNLLGSPGSAERSLNILTVSVIFSYFVIALLANIE
jgi:preprotein translocase subunit SecG